MFLKTGRKRVARVGRARDQDARIRERAALLGERIRQRLGNELVGHDRRYDASLFQRLGRDAADRGDRGGREYARREPPGDEPIEHDVHSVLAGEHDPPVCGETRQRGAQRAEVFERLDADHRSKHCLGAAGFERPHQLARLFARAGDHDPASLQSSDACHALLQSHRGSTHYQPMLRSFRAALGRFCARRAAAAQRDAPQRALEDRWGAVEAAREASVRFPDHADAWMLLGEALQMVFRQDEALGAFEQALALEERADAAMAAGTLYQRTGRFPEAAARFARAYAAGGGATALWHNAQALYDAGDHGAADEALNLWATQVPDGHSRLPEARAELRAKASARAQVQ